MLTVNNGIVSNASNVGQTAGVDGAPSAAVSAGLSGSAASLSALLLDTTPTADAGASGLRSPVNPENSDALLLLVESQSDQASAATRGASLTSRFAAAQNAIGNSGAALQGALQNAADTLKAADDKLATSQSKLASDKAADADTTADQKAVEDDTQGVATARAALQTILSSTDVPTAVGLIAKALGADIAQDASRHTGASAHRDIAYEDVADTAKRFRDDEVDRVRQDGARRTQGGEESDENRAAKLAAAVATGMIDAMATIQAALTSRAPVVSPTAAMESGGRVRLSL